MPVKPPYPAGSLYVPLTTTQRARMRAYILAATGVTESTKLNDVYLIEDYNNIASGGGFGLESQGGITGAIEGVGKSAGEAASGPINVFSNLEDLLKFLLDPVRLGEIVGGMILLAVGVNAMLKSGGAPSVSSSTAKKLLTPPPARAVSKAIPKTAPKGNPLTGMDVKKVAKTHDPSKFGRTTHYTKVA